MLTVWKIYASELMACKHSVKEDSLVALLARKLCVLATDLHSFATE